MLKKIRDHISRKREENARAREYIMASQISDPRVRDEVLARLGE